MDMGDRNVWTDPAVGDVVRADSIGMCTIVVVGPKVVRHRSGVGGGVGEAGLRRRARAEFAALGDGLSSRAQRVEDERWPA